MSKTGSFIDLPTVYKTNSFEGRPLRRRSSVLQNELVPARDQEQQIALSRLDLRMSRVFSHHHEIALPVNQFAPSDIAFEYKTLLVIVMEMGGNSSARIHADEHGRSPRPFITKQTPHFDAGLADIPPFTFVAPNVRQRLQHLVRRHAHHKAALEFRGRR